MASPNDEPILAALAIVVWLGTSCERTGEPGATEATTESLATPTADGSPFGDGFAWILQQPGPGLILTVGDLEPSWQDVEPADLVPLANGRLVVRATFHPHEYETLCCYVELERVEDRWRPARGGLFFGWCCGAYWLEDLEGTITLDAIGPTSLCFVLVSGEETRSSPVSCATSCRSSG